MKKKAASNTEYRNRSCLLQTVATGKKTDPGISEKKKNNTGYTQTIQRLLSRRSDKSKNALTIVPQARQRNDRIPSGPSRTTGSLNPPPDPRSRRTPLPQPSRTQPMALDPAPSQLSAGVSRLHATHGTHFHALHQPHRRGDWTAARCL